MSVPLSSGVLNLHDGHISAPLLDCTRHPEGRDVLRFIQRDAKQLFKLNRRMGPVRFWTQWAAEGPRNRG